MGLIVSLLIEKARQLAHRAHDGQRRKYTGEPYIVHPEAVAKIVSSVTDDPHVIAAAWLHDVVEDTSVTIDMIEAGFGKETAALVLELTNAKTPGNRAYRKENDRKRMAGACVNAKTIKLADILHNVQDIIKNDPDFAVVYVDEERAMLEESLIGGDQALYAAAKEIIYEFITRQA